MAIATGVTTDELHHTQKMCKICELALDEGMLRVSNPNDTTISSACQFEDCAGRNDAIGYAPPSRSCSAVTSVR